MPIERRGWNPIPSWEVLRVLSAKRNYNITHQEGDNKIITDNKNFYNKKNPNNKLSNTTNTPFVRRCITPLHIKTIPYNNVLSSWKVQVHYTTEMVVVSFLAPSRMRWSTKVHNSIIAMSAFAVEWSCSKASSRQGIDRGTCSSLYHFSICRKNDKSDRSLY